jgi:hypothetical protein
VPYLDWLDPGIVALFSAQHFGVEVVREVVVVVEGSTCATPWCARVTVTLLATRATRDAVKNTIHLVLQIGPVFNERVVATFDLSCTNTLVFLE